MTTLVRSFAKRMASFSNLKEKAARDELLENDTALDISIDSLDPEPLARPMMNVSRFGNRIHGIRKRIGIKQHQAPSDQTKTTTAVKKNIETTSTATAQEEQYTPATSPSIATGAVLAHQHSHSQSDPWEILQGGKLSERPPEELATYVRIHMIDVDIDRTDPDALLPNVKELSIVSSTPANLHALSPLLPQLKDLWVNDVLGFPYVPRNADSRAEYKKNLIASVSSFADQFQQYLMNSYDISDVSFKEPDFRGYLRSVHKLSHLTFPATVYNPRNFFQRQPVLQITTLPRGFLQDSGQATIERPLIDTIEAPGLRQLQLHVIGQFPRVRRFEAKNLQEVTLVFSSIQDVDMFEGFTDEDIRFLLGVKKIIYKGFLSLLKKMTLLLEEYTGGISLEIFDAEDEQELREIHFHKVTRVEITTRLTRTPWVNAPLTKHYTIVYQNPVDPVTLINVSSCFPLLITLEIKSKDSKALAMKEPPLVTLLWMDRGCFSNLEVIHMSSRTRLESGFFTHSFPTLKQAKLTTLSKVIDNGLSQWGTPLLEELELYVDHTKTVGEIGDFSIVVSGFRCLRELYVKGITHLVIENCPYLELINSRYAGPMKSLNVTGSCILRGLVYDSPEGKVVDNVSKACDRFVREYRAPVRNYYLMVYDSFFTAFPTDLEDDIMTKGRLF